VYQPCARLTCNHTRNRCVYWASDFLLTKSVHSCEDNCQLAIVRSRIISYKRAIQGRAIRRRALPDLFGGLVVYYRADSIALDGTVGCECSRFVVLLNSMHSTL
jgi:hypothetical protein